MTKEQITFLQGLLSSALSEARENIRQAEIADTYHGTMSSVKSIKDKIQLIEECYKELTKELV